MRRAWRVEDWNWTLAFAEHRWGQKPEACVFKTNWKRLGHRCGAAAYAALEPSTSSAWLKTAKSAVILNKDTRQLLLFDKFSLFIVFFQHPVATQATACVSAAPEQEPPGRPWPRADACRCARRQIYFCAMPPVPLAAAVATKRFTIVHAGHVG
jgi:hypothetical protein